MPSNTVAIKVGRLMEVRVDAGYRSEEEVDQVFAAIGAEMRARAPAGQPLITVADWRRCPLLEARAAARLSERMAGNNPLVVRSAALVSPTSPTSVLQFTRLIRESDFEDRRMFTAVPPLMAWLADLLTPAEMERLQTFLGSP